MRKIILKIWLYIEYVFHGMRIADDILLGGSGDELDGGVNKESRKINEQHKVYQDMLRGELTEEVKEVRHEMYFSERESKKYEYSGGGHAKKKNIFGYNGNIENSANLKVLLVQENEEDIGGLFSDLDPNKTRTFLLNFKRDFLPTNRVEEFAKKVVVFKNDNNAIIDLYFDDYVRQFDRRNRIFVNELYRILEGDRRSELLDFNSIYFTTKNAYGADDNIVYEYNKKEYAKSFVFEGSIVLRFICEGGKKEDLLDEIYHKETAKKIMDKAPREKNNKTFDFMSTVENNYDAETADTLIKEMKDGEN